MSIIATLCFIIKENQVLLIRKKRGFGNGKWNGPGGKTNNGESIVDCVKRELNEEVGLIPINPKNQGKLEFFFGSEKQSPDWIVHVFVADEFSGSVKESEEALPKWFEMDKIPYNKMWEDDKYWLPSVLQGKNVNGRFFFSEDMKKLLNHKLDIIN